MATANAILRAFNNRKYIFFVTLMLDQAKLKAVEEKKKEEQGEAEHTSAISFPWRCTPFGFLYMFELWVGIAGHDFNVFF